MKELRVLITGAGAPGIKGTLYSLKNNWESRKVNVTGVDAKKHVVGRYLCDNFHTVPPGGDPEFIPSLLDICSSESIDVVLPQVTRELFPLSSRREEFEKRGTKVAVSSKRSIDLANDKSELMKTAQSIGVPTPSFETVNTWSQLEKSSQSFEKPFVVKPPVSWGMRGYRLVFEKLDRKKQFFEEKPDSSRITMEELYNILGENFPPLLVMEYLPGKEYSVDVLSSGEETVVIPRCRDLIRGGITFNGSVERREDIIDYSRRLTDKINLRYAYGFQFKEREDGVPCLIESNPRIQGTMVLATFAGANIIYGAVKMALNEPIPKFDINWETKLLRYWGGVGVEDGSWKEII